jgi:hypothetical protein
LYDLRASSFALCGDTGNALSAPPSLFFEAVAATRTTTRWMATGANALAIVDAREGTDATSRSVVITSVATKKTRARSSSAKH